MVDLEKQKPEGTCACQGCRRPAGVEASGMCAYCDDHAYHAHCRECGSPVIERGGSTSDSDVLCKMCRSRPL